MPYVHQAFENERLEDGDALHAISSMSPYMSAYYSKIPASWSFLFLSIDDFEDIPAVIFRDGIISLLAFFKRFPSPDQLKTRIYISPALVNFIPISWQKNIGVFEIYTKNKKTCKHVLITGVGATPLLEQSIDLFEKLFTGCDTVTILAVDRRYNNIGADVYKNIDMSNNILFFLEKLKAKFPNLPFQIVLDTKLDEVQNITDSVVFDATEFCFEYSDSSLSHRLYTLGASKFKSKYEVSNKKVTLSRNHGFYLHDDVKLSANGISNAVVRMTMEDDVCWINERKEGPSYVYNDELFHLAYFCLKNYGELDL